MSGKREIEGFLNEIDDGCYVGEEGGPQNGTWFTARGFFKGFVGKKVRITIEEIENKSVMEMNMHERIRATSRFYGLDKK